MNETAKDESTKPADSTTNVEAPEEKIISTGDATTGEFNPSDLAAEYGIPEEVLKDVKDEDSAVLKIREYTDNLLKASLEAEDEAEPVVDPAAPRVAPVQDSVAAKLAANQGKEAPKTDDEVAALKKRLDAYEQREAWREEAQFAAAQKSVEQRLAARVDSWASPKYGVTGSRDYKQTKAFKEFKQSLLDEFAPSILKKEGAVPTVEVVAERLRSWHDPEGFDSARQGKKSDTKATPLGTPGQQLSSADAEAPRNIHEAYLSGGRFVKIKSPS